MSRYVAYEGQRQAGLGRLDIYISALTRRAWRRSRTKSCRHMATGDTFHGACRTRLKGKAGEALKTKSTVRPEDLCNEVLHVGVVWMQLALHNFAKRGTDALATNSCYTFCSEYFGHQTLSYSSLIFSRVCEVVDGHTAEAGLNSLIQLQAWPRQRLSRAEDATLKA